MTGRAKWDAWAAAGQTYGTEVHGAEQRYLSIARELGWTFSAAVEITPEVLTEDGFQGSDGDIWDKNDISSNQGGGGMSTGVSAFAPPEVDEHDANTPHGMAVSNNAEGLKSYLAAHPEVDLNELDEHVSRNSILCASPSYTRIHTGIYSLAPCL